MHLGPKYAVPFKKDGPWLRCIIDEKSKLTLGQGDQKIRKKWQIFQRLAQKVAESKNAKISSTKLNIYIKPLLKP
jgi:hypothetical protein